MSIFLKIYSRGPPASLLATLCDTQNEVLWDRCRICFRWDKDEDRPWAAWKRQARKSWTPPMSHCPIILVLPQENVLETWPKDVQASGGHVPRSV